MAHNPLSAYTSLQVQKDRDLARILEIVARDIRKRVASLPSKTGGQVRKAQLNAVLGQILKIEDELWNNDISEHIRQGREEAAFAADKSARLLQTYMSSKLPDREREELLSGIEATARAGIEADYHRLPRALSARIYDNYQDQMGNIEDTIRSGIIQGLSAKELSKTVYKYVSPTAPGGQSYAANRLARTEINNAFHNQQIAAADRPGVKGGKWNLSGSHPRPDDCNKFADTDQFNLGAGVFPSDKVPGKPHPNCLCYLTYITMTPDQFLNAWDKGEFDDELDKRTKANLERIREQESPSEPKSKPSRPQSQPKTKTPSKARVSTAEDRAFDDRVAKGTKSSKKLAKGATAEVDLVTLKDGSKVVKKRITGDEWREREATQDAEELAAKLGQSFKIRVPRVNRESEDSVFMEFVTGKTGMQIEKATKLRPQLHDRFDPDEVNRAGLFDIVTGNTDRSDGNWMEDDDGKLWAIDHGFAFSYGKGKQQVRENLFTSTNSRFADKVRGKPEDDEPLGDSALYTPADVKYMENALTELRPEFARLDHMDWYNEAIKRVRSLKKHAKGKVNLF